MVRLIFLIQKYKTAISFLYFLLIYCSLCDFSITICGPELPPVEDAVTPKTVTEMQNQTCQKLDSSTGYIKIERTAHVDGEGLSCETLCTKISAMGYKLHGPICDTACGDNSKQIIDGLEGQTRETINKKLSRKGVVGYLINDLDSSEKK